MRVFVAGGSGAIGRRLVPQLVAAGHAVVATTRTPGKVPELRALGAEAVVLDGLDACAVGEAVARAEPDAIVHQMTALAGMSDLKHFDRGFARTNELRTAGTDALLAAASAAGVGRFVAQSFAGWPTAPVGDGVTTEEDPLDPHPVAGMAQSHAAIRRLEEAVLAAPLEGIVLRYGGLYGPGASDAMVDVVRARKFPIVGSGAGVWSFVHVDDAASATVAAVERGAPGVYNVVDDDPAPVSEWLPYLAGAIGAPAPRHVPAWLGRIAAGEVGIAMMTRIHGASNAKARRELGWRPAYASWRSGFRDALADAQAGRDAA
jgi:nucleoside-diphosphate-sugar epimerase